MSTYPIEKLLQMWRREEVTVEQVIGQRSAELTSKPVATPGRARSAGADVAKTNAKLATDDQAVESTETVELTGVIEAVTH